MLRKNYRIVLLSILIVLSLLFVIKKVIFSDWQSRTLLIMAKPIEVGNNLISRLTSPISGIFQIGDLDRENKELRIKLIEAQEKDFNLAILENENKILKEELNVQNNTTDLLGAKVIGKNPVLESGSVLINRGKKDGIQVGKAVTYNGFLVGMIEAVKDEISTVRLINSSQTLIPVTIIEANTIGLLSSRFEGIVVEQVLVDKKIAIGDKIVSNDIEKETGSNLLIGEVSDIISSPSDIYQTLKVKTPIDFQGLQFLFVHK